VKTTTTMMVLALGLASPAAAQRPAQPPARPAPRRPLPPLPPEPSISFRPFVMGAEEAFAATQTFKAIFGKSYAPFFGGGLQVAFHGKYYVEMGASRFQQTGQRVFRNNRQNFNLGIPLTATITPLEITGGYRFRPRQLRQLRPYVGAGFTSYSYKEVSDFADADGNLTTRHGGLVGVGGVEFRLHRYVGLSADMELSHVTGILGQQGISKEVGESNLGGISARFRLIVGR
jgi:hypothetical protein